MTYARLEPRVVLLSSTRLSITSSYVQSDPNVNFLVHEYLQNLKCTTAADQFKKYVGPEMLVAIEGMSVVLGNLKYRWAAEKSVVEILFVLPPWRSSTSAITR